VVVEDRELLDEEEAASEADTSAAVFVTVIYVVALERGIRPMTRTS
jgi:hypothetical protein